MMKKIIMGIMTFLLCFVSMSTVMAEGLYYMPNKGESYLKSEHVYSFVNTEGELENNYRAIVHTLVKEEIDTSSFDSSVDFTKRFEVPWTRTNEEYFLVYCADLNVPAIELKQYKKVPIESSTFIDEKVKANLIGMLKSTWPYISLDEAISNLVAENVLVGREVNGVTYYTSPLNLEPTKSITEHEFVSALQMAIFYYTNPNQIESVYGSTLPVESKTVLSPSRPYNNPWDVGEDEYEAVSIDEAKNNVMALYNYFINKTGADEAFKVETANIVSKDNSYVVTIKTNRDFNSKDDIVLTLSQNEEEIGKYNIADLQKDGTATYSMTVDNNSKNNLSLAYTGTEFVDLKTYAFEAVEGKEQAQTFVGVASAYLPVEGRVSVIVPPVTDSFTTVSAVVVLVISFIGVIYLNVRRKFYK